MSDTCQCERCSKWVEYDDTELVVYIEGNCVFCNICYDELIDGDFLEKVERDDIEFFHIIKKPFDILIQITHRLEPSGIMWEY